MNTGEIKEVSNLMNMKEEDFCCLQPSRVS